MEKFLLALFAVIRADIPEHSFTWSPTPLPTRRPTTSPSPSPTSYPSADRFTQKPVSSLPRFYTNYQSTDCGCRSLGDHNEPTYCGGKDKLSKLWFGADFTLETESTIPLRISSWYGSYHPPKCMDGYVSKYADFSLGNSTIPVLRTYDGQVFEWIEGGFLTQAYPNTFTDLSIRIRDLRLNSVSKINKYNEENKLGHNSPGFVACQAGMDSDQHYKSMCAILNNDDIVNVRWIYRSGFNQGFKGLNIPWLNSTLGGVCHTMTYCQKQEGLMDDGGAAQLPSQSQSMADEIDSRLAVKMDEVDSRLAVCESRSRENFPYTLIAFMACLMIFLYVSPHTAHQCVSCIARSCVQCFGFAKPKCS